MKHKIKLSCGTVLEVSEHDLINIEHYKEAADYNRRGWEAAEAKRDAIPPYYPLMHQAKDLLRKMYNISPEDCCLDEIVHECTSELEAFDAIRAMGEKYGLKAAGGSPFSLRDPDYLLDVLRTTIEEKSKPENKRFLVFASVEMSNDEAGVVLTIPDVCSLLGDFDTYEDAVQGIRQIESCIQAHDIGGSNE